MEMLGGFSDLLWTDQQGNRGQGMGVGCWTVIGAPELCYEILTVQQYTCMIRIKQMQSDLLRVFKIHMLSGKNELFRIQRIQYGLRGSPKPEGNNIFNP